MSSEFILEQEMKQFPVGWHCRGYLQHFNGVLETQAITFRLADSLPFERLRSLEWELKHVPRNKREATRRRQIERCLDHNFGSCALRIPEIATMVEDAILFFNEDRYELYAWVIMPNHVHVLLSPNSDYAISSIVGSWKSYTSKRALNYLGSDGPFWQADYFDRYIRDDSHFVNALTYIENNPVKAGLVASREQWLYSSAYRGRLF